MVVCTTSNYQVWNCFIFWLPGDFNLFPWGTNYLFCDIERIHSPEWVMLRNLIFTLLLEPCTLCWCFFESLYLYDFCLDILSIIIEAFLYLTQWNATVYLFLLSNHFCSLSIWIIKYSLVYPSPFESLFLFIFMIFIWIFSQFS